MLSFLAVIFMGSLLLSLPISSASGHAVPYLDALFTATTATCVTGLVTLPTVTTWSVFGQAEINSTQLLNYAACLYNGNGASFEKSQKMNGNTYPFFRTITS